MTDAISKALREGLGAYLQTQLAVTFPQIVVSGEWPAPEEPLPAQAVTVLTSGIPRAVYHDPIPHVITPATGSVTANVVYSYGTATVDMQLDAWSTYRDVRDQLSQAVEAAVNRPPADTLGLTQLPHYSRKAGLVIRLPNLFNLPVDFRFAPIPDSIEGTDAAQRSEWRASWSGTAFLYLLNQEQVALLKTLTFSFGNLTRTITAP